jgi:hypothetical protein
MQVKLGCAYVFSPEWMYGNRFMKKLGKGTAFIFASYLLPATGSLCLGGEEKGPTNQKGLFQKWNIVEEVQDFLSSYLATPSLSSQPS